MLSTKLYFHITSKDSGAQYWAGVGGGRVFCSSLTESPNKKQLPAFFLTLMFKPQIFS